MSIVELAVASYGFAAAVSMSRGTFRKLAKYTDFKPLNCRFCLSFWFSFAYLLIIGIHYCESAIHSLFAAGVTYILLFVETALTPRDKGPIG